MPVDSTSANGAPRRRGRWTVRRGIERLILLALALAGWQLAATSGVFSQGTLPTLDVFWNALVLTVPSPAFWTAIGNTMLSWLMGLGIAVAIAVPVGLTIGSTALLRRLTTPTLDFMRTIPAIILVPLVVLLYGSTNITKVILIVFTCVWPLMLQATYGIRAVNPVARQTFAAYGIRRMDRIRFLYLPTASPYLATGLRLAAVSSLLAAIGIEIIASARGIGYEIGVKQANGLAGASFVYLLTAAVIGLIITTVFSAVERRAMYWHPSERGVTV